MVDQEAEAKKIFWDLTSLQKRNPNNGEEQDRNNWMVARGSNSSDNVCYSSAESSMENSTNSAASSFSSSSSTDLTEDASSSSPLSTLTSPPANTNGPLFQLSELMAQLPIKRGLSKFYNGKSQSYTSLASVKSLEDLAKKVTNTPYRSKMKSCKSYAGVLDGHSNNNNRNNNIRKSYSPKAIISKRVSSSSSRGSSLSSLGKNRSGSLING